MSERGVFAVDRGIWDHPAFDPEPFTQREAWIWLVGEATHRARIKKIDGVDVELARGQLGHSVRFMAAAWQWSKSRVDRFLRALEKRDMLHRESGTKTAVLTICNYDDYQRVSLPKRDDVGTVTGTTAGQQRDKLEDTKNTRDSLVRNSASPTAGETPARKTKNGDFERFRAAYPKRDGTDPKEPARKKFEAMVKSGADPERIIAGAVAFAVAEQKRGNVGSRFIPHSATWLNKRQWEDHQPQPAASLAAEADSWRIPVENWRRDPSTWASHAWGPAPGEPGCQVPKNLLSDQTQAHEVH